MWQKLKHEQSLIKKAQILCIKPHTKKYVLNLHQQFQLGYFIMTHLFPPFWGGLNCFMPFNLTTNSPGNQAYYHGNQRVHLNKALITDSQYAIPTFISPVLGVFITSIIDKIQILPIGDQIFGSSERRNPKERLTSVTWLHQKMFRN